MTKSATRPASLWEKKPTSCPAIRTRRFGLIPTWCNINYTWSTTPLWGRGLHQRCTGAEFADRLHDCRARNVIEAIMWHGTSTESDAYKSVEQFRQLSKADRDAIVKFIDSI